MCHLPVNNSQEEKAFFKILSYLRRLKNRILGVTGWTTSTFVPPCFTVGGGLRSAKNGFGTIWCSASWTTIGL